MWPLTLLTKLLSFIPQLVTGVNFASMLPPVFANIKQYWKIYVITALVGLQVFTFYEWRKTGSELRAERAAHQQDIKSFKQAQIDAQKKTEEMRQKLVTENKEKANAADQNYASLLATYHANLVRYKALAGLRGGPGGGQVGGSAKVPNGPGANPQFPDTVTITANDAEICTENTARLQSAHDWALTVTGKANDTH